MTVYDPATGKPIRAPHNFTSLKIRRISGVDSPAQEPAKVVLLMKHRDEARTEKGCMPERPALTTSVNGHAHLLDLAAASGSTSWEVSGEHGHAHPYVVTEGGLTVIGEAAGHTHQIEVQAAKADITGDHMPNATATGSAPATDNAQRIAELEKSLARQTALASMDDAQRAHFATLKGADAEAFLVAAPEQRSAVVDAVKAADAVVYKAADGTEYRRSDDVRLVAMAKRADERDAELRRAREEQELLVLKARAQSEIPHLPGDEAVKVALLKAVGGIPDEATRTKALETLKANDAGIAEAFRRSGTRREPALGTSTDPEAQLNAMATKRANEKGITFEQAYSQVSREPEGRALFAAAINPNV